MESLVGRAREPREATSIIFLNNDILNSYIFRKLQFTFLFSLIYYLAIRNHVYYNKTHKISIFIKYIDKTSNLISKNINFK